MYKGLLIGLCCVASVVQAAAPDWFVGGSIGRGRLSYDLSHLNLTGGVFDNNGYAGALFGGYQFDDNWAVEASYLHFYTAKIYAMTPGSGTGEMNAHATALAAKGIIHFLNAYSIFARAGAAYFTENPNSALAANYSGRSGVKPYFGGGGSYDINSNLSADVQYYQIVRSSMKAWQYGVGLTVHF